MPPKVIYEKETLLKTALSLLRDKGQESLTARNIAKRQGCSTHPIYSEFNSIKELKAELYKVSYEYFTNFITTGNGKIDFLDIGVNYVLFSKKEKNLFSFLFLNKNFEINLEDVGKIDRKIIKSIREDEYVQKNSIENHDEIFFNLWVFAHGLATLTYNSKEPFNEKVIRRILEKTGDLIYKGMTVKQ